MAGVYDVFHVSYLRKCVLDSSVVIQPSQLKEVGVQLEIARRKELVCIIDL